MGYAMNSDRIQCIEDEKINGHQWDSKKVGNSVKLKAVSSQKHIEQSVWMKHNYTLRWMVVWQ